MLCTRAVSLISGSMYSVMQQMLAAVQPASGHFDTRRSPSENIGLPQDLLLGFDLLWFITDNQDDVDTVRKRRPIDKARQLL